MIFWWSAVNSDNIEVSNENLSEVKVFLHLPGLSQSGNNPGKHSHFPFIKPISPVVVIASHVKHLFKLFGSQVKQIESKLQTIHLDSTFLSYTNPS